MIQIQHSTEEEHRLYKDFVPPIDWTIRVHTGNPREKYRDLLSSLPAFPGVRYSLVSGPGTSTDAIYLPPGVSNATVGLIAASWAALDLDGLTKALATIGQELSEKAHGLFHMLWTNTNGPKYNKRDWQALDLRLQRLPYRDKVVERITVLEAAYRLHAQQKA